MFEILDKDLAGRIGKLYTKTGIIETPALFPVINPQKQTVTLEEIKSIGFRQIITNSYLIKKNFGDLCTEVGVHNLLQWDLPIMTDSGAYQLMEYGEVEVDPDEILKYQIDIGTDIGVILDVPTRANTDREIVFLEVEETLRRARRALLLREEYDPEHRTLLVGPVQGGEHVDIVAYSAKKLSEMDFEIYAIGSVTLHLEQYNFEKIVDMIMAAKLNLPLGKPVHLFGAGHPLIMPIAVALGIDMFDSASYILYARDDRIMLPDRTLRIEDVKIEYIPCCCPVCSKYSVKELKEMSKDERERLIAIHNLHILKREIEEIKQRIKEGTLWEYLQEKSAADARLRRAFIRIVKLRKILEKLTPTTRGDIHGIDITCILDIARPHIVQHTRKLVNRYVPPHKEILLILPDPEEKPYNRSIMFIKVVNVLKNLNMLNRVHICFLSDIFGIVPHEISDIYPLAQYEDARYLKCVRNIGKTLTLTYLKSKISNYKIIIAMLPKNELEELRRMLRSLKVNVKFIGFTLYGPDDKVSIDSICSMVLPHVFSALLREPYEAA
ncbi:MAG: tRNA guanosine(15) transglycosylase TgtA [Crenarchaeota archaeon]|nr:tRNA guanosine(15) transglycosylase TgtA [Thermoproteota archaeon]